MIRQAAVVIHESLRGGIAVGLGAAAYLASVVVLWACGGGASFPDCVTEGIAGAFLLVQLQWPRFVACVAICALVIGGCSTTALVARSGRSRSRRCLVGCLVGLLFASLYLYLPSAAWPNGENLDGLPPLGRFLGWWHVPLAGLWGMILGAAIGPDGLGHPGR